MTGASIKGVKPELEGSVRLAFEHMCSDATEAGGLARGILASRGPFRSCDQDPLVPHCRNQVEGVIGDAAGEQPGEKRFYPPGP